MTHNVQAEMKTKCRRLFYAKVDITRTREDGTVELRTPAGAVLGVASGGGALEELSGDALIISTFNDLSAPDRIGCVEEFYNPIPARRPLTVNLAKIQACHNAVDAHRVAKKAERDYIFETGIVLSGNELTGPDLDNLLKVNEVRTRTDGRIGEHQSTLDAQSRLEQLKQDCEQCCTIMLDARDDAITFAPIAPVS